MIILDYPQTGLQALLGESVSANKGVDISLSYADGNNTNDPATNQSLFGYLPSRIHNFSATSATVLVGGQDGRTRVIKEMSFCNNDSISHTLTLSLIDQTATYLLLDSYVIPSLCTLYYLEGFGFSLIQPGPIIGSLLSNTSASKTPAASGNWNSGSATITLTPGTWAINGSVFFTTVSGNSNLTVLDYALCTADGANSSSIPALVTTKVGQPTSSSFNSVAGHLWAVNTTANVNQFVAAIEPVIIATAVNKTIYLVPFGTMTTPANTRIVTDLWGQLISPATS